ncbi:MAG: tetratricopeptide repeat protein [Verrucomicrobiota bacterium]
MLFLLLVSLVFTGCKREKVDFAANAREAEIAGNLPVAIQNYERATRDQPGDLALRERLVELLFKESRDEEAVPHLLLLARQRRDDAALLVKTINLLLEFGGWKESKELYDLAPAPVQNTPAVQEMYAELLAREAKFIEALKVLDEVIKAPNTPAEVVRSASLRRGRLLHQTGKPGEALKEFNDLIERQPEDSEALLLRANLHMAMRKYAEAKAAYEAINQRFPKEHEAWLGLASLAVQEKRMEDAIQAYEKALAINPKDSDILFWLAELHFERSDKTALAALKDKAQGRKFEREVFQGYLRGMELMGAGAYREAVKELERLQPLLSGYPGLYDKIGICYLKLGEPVQAEAAFAKLPHDEAVQEQVWSALGQSYLSVTNYARAVRWLEVARGKERLGALAQAQFGVGDLDAAYKNAVLWIKEEPRSINALLIAAEAARRLDVDVQGQGYFEQIAAISPDTAAGIYARAQLLVGSNLFAEAATLLEQKREVLATQAGPILLLAEMKLRLGQNDDARKYLAQTLKLEPNYARAHALSGILAQSAGDESAAARHFDTALAADSTDRVALMGKGFLAYRRDDYFAAAELFDRASNLRRPEAEAALFWTLSEFGRADWKRALLAAERAVRLAPTNAFARYLEVRGNMANQQWSRASQLAADLNRQHAGYAPGYHALALISLNTNGVEQALSFVQHGLQLQTTNLLLQPLEIELLRTTKQTDAAWAKLENLKRTFPTEPDRFLAEINLLFDRKDHASARRICLAGLESNPRDGRLQQRLLDTFIVAKQESEAAPVMEEILKRDDKNLALRFTCARLREVRGDWAQAEAHYREVLKGDTQNVATLNNLSLVVAREPKRLEEAVKLAQKAYLLAGKSAAVADTLATLMLATGDARQAVTLLEAARKQAPKNVDIHLNYVEALIARGLPGEARKELEALGRENPQASQRKQYQTLSAKLTAGEGGLPGKAQ